MKRANRTLLCRHRSLAGQDSVFLTPEGVDVDSAEHYEVIRRRVFFDDVRFVSIHKERGLAFLLTTGFFGTLFLAFGIFILSVDTDGWPVALPMLIMGGIPFAAFLFRLTLGRSVVTVFGRRSKAVLRFGAFRRQRARDIYGQICAAVRRAQGRMATG